MLKYFIWAGNVYAASFNGSFNGDGANLNLVSNSIIQTILTNISVLSKSAYPVGIESLRIRQRCYGHDVSFGVQKYCRDRHLGGNGAFD